MTNTPPETSNSAKTRGRSASGVRRGHMVTKWYLKAWADEHNVVDVIDVLEGRGHPSAVGDASVVSYVYDPEVLGHDLEGAFGEIESAAAPAFARLRAGEVMTMPDLTAVIAFLDMHLHRGRYANRVGVRQPALLYMKDGTVQEAELNYADLLSLAHDHPDTLRLTTLGLEQREWRIQSLEGLFTGDGAVLLIGPSRDQDPTTITFPMSPTQLLVIGDDLPAGVPINHRIVANSRRWVVGQRGSLPIAAVRRMKAQLDADAEAAK